MRPAIAIDLDRALILENGGFDVAVLPRFRPEVTEESMQHRALLRIRREPDGGTIFGDGPSKLFFFRAKAKFQRASR